MKLLLLFLILLGNNTVQCGENNKTTEEGDEENEAFVEVLVIVDQALNDKLNNENIVTIDYVTNVFSIVNMLFSILRLKIEFTIENILIEGENIGLLPFKKSQKELAIDLYFNLFDKIENEQKKFMVNYLMDLMDGRKISAKDFLIDVILWRNETSMTADIVVVMTSLDLCWLEPVKNVSIDGLFSEYYTDYLCSVLGLSMKGCACNKSENVAVVGMKKNAEWDLLDDVFVLAHEIAHLLNLTHDGESIDWCKANEGYIMSPAISAKKVTLKKLVTGQPWSKCSLEQFRKYLPNFQCLKNEPTDNKYPLKTMLPSTCFANSNGTKHPSTTCLYHLFSTLGLFWKLEGWNVLLGHILGDVLP